MDVLVEGMYVDFGDASLAGTAAVGAAVGSGAMRNTQRFAAAGDVGASLTRLADYRRDVRPVPVRHLAPGLSTREVEVLLEWLGADSKEQAAEVLFISASTVSTHLARIRAKYAAVGRSAPTKTHLFARALQDGYTSLDKW